MNRLPNRALGASEKLFWLLDQVSPVHFVMAADLSGTIDIMQLQKAITAILQRHPLLSSRIIANDYEHPYFEHVPQAVAPLSVIEASPDALPGIIARELATPFDSEVAPLVRFLLIKHATHPVIVVAAHHSTSDGISMTIVFRDLLQALQGEALTPAAMPLSTEQLAGIGNGTATTYGASGNIALPRETRTLPQVYLRALDAADTATILRKSREAGTTFQGALYAAAIRAARGSALPWSNSQIKVIVPVSLRETLTDESSSCLYITSKALLSQPNDNTDFWPLAGHARQELLPSQDPAALETAIGMVQERMFSGKEVQALAAMLQQGKVREMMLSNLGRYPYPTTAGGLRLQRVWGPVALSGTPNEITIGVTTVNGEVCLTMATPLEAPAFLDRLIAELYAACELV